MKSLWIVLIAIAACTAQAQQPCLKLTEVKMGNQLRQYGATEARLKFEAQNNNCYVLTASQPLNQQEPTLTVDLAPVGVTATLKAVEAQPIDQGSVGTATLKTREISTIIALDASWQSMAGDYTFFGTLHYNTVDSAGTVKQEFLPFSFQLGVTSPKRPDGENAFVKDLKRKGELAAAIVLFPIVLLIGLIYCPISGQCGDC